MLTGINNPYVTANNVSVNIVYTDNTMQSTYLTSQELFPDIYSDETLSQSNKDQYARMHFKTGKWFKGLDTLNQYFQNNAALKYEIEGGEASIYFFKADPFKRCKQIQFSIVSDQVSIGILGISLVKDFTTSQNIANQNKDLSDVKFWASLIE